MKVLFDQNVPRNLARYLEGHEVTTAANLGWEELANGELLSAAEAAGFSVFITCDQSLRYQQNLIDRKISLIELTKNNWPSIKPYVEEISCCVDTCMEGGYRTIECAFLYRARKKR